MPETECASEESTKGMLMPLSPNRPSRSQDEDGNPRLEGSIGDQRIVVVLARDAPNLVITTILRK